MVIALIGVGQQGKVLAQILTQDLTISKIYLIDINQQRLENCIKSLNSKKICPKIIDIKNITEIVMELKDCEIYIDMSFPKYTLNVMRAALINHANYINTAYDSPFWEELVNGDELSLDREFKQIGKKALLGCGNSPGIVNVLIKKYCDKLYKINTIQIYGAYKEIMQPPSAGWNPGWAYKQAYIDYITSPVVFRNGKYIKLAPFSEIKEMDFPQYGIKRLAIHSHEENYSLPYVIQKGIQKCEFRYEVDLYAAILYSCGFTLNNKIEINNEKFKTVDILFKIMDEIENIDENIKVNEYSSLVNIIGQDKNGEKKEVSFLIPPLLNNEKFRWFGIVKGNIEVALPVYVGMKCIQDIKNGVCFAENLKPERFLEVLNQYLPYKEIKLK